MKNAENFGDQTMSQMTIREQIELALKLMPTAIYDGEPQITRDNVRLYMYEQFDENSVAHSFNVNFDEIAAKMGYVKRDPDKVVIKRVIVEKCLYELLDYATVTYPSDVEVPISTRGVIMALRQTLEAKDDTGKP